MSSQQDRRINRVLPGGTGVKRLALLAAMSLLPQLALAQVTSQSAPNATLPEVNVIGATPLLGSGVDRNKVPAENQVLTSRDVTLEGPPSYLATLQDQAQGVQLNSAAGKPFQPNLFYHGFQASPLQGTPKGWPCI